MKIRNQLVILFISVGLSACGASNPYYTHPAHGKVDKSSPIYLADRAECDKLAFGDGFSAGGSLIKSVSEAASYMSDHYLKQIHSGKKTSDWEPLDKKAELETLIKKSNDCIESRDWTYHNKNS